MHTTECATQLLAACDVAAEAIRRGDPLTPAGVRLAAATGRLHVAAITPRGHRLYASEDVTAFLNERAKRRHRRMAA